MWVVYVYRICVYVHDTRINIFLFTESEIKWRVYAVIL